MCLSNCIAVISGETVEGKISIEKIKKQDDILYWMIQMVK